MQSIQRILPTNLKEAEKRHAIKSPRRPPVEDKYSKTKYGAI